MEPNPVTLFAALAHDTRLRCLVLLARQEELCVCDLTSALGLSQPHISRHLAHLREAGWVTDRRDGVWVYYRIAQGLPPWALQVLDHSARGMAGHSPFAQDLLAVTGWPRSGPASCAAQPPEVTACAGRGPQLTLISVILYDPCMRPTTDIEGA
jgi:ArsR family transcriptional regulator